MMYFLLKVSHSPSSSNYSNIQWSGVVDDHLLEQQMEFIPKAIKTIEIAVMHPYIWVVKLNPEFVPGINNRLFVTHWKQLTFDEAKRLCKDKTWYYVEER